MRIVTWNVNGIRAALGKGALEWMAAYGGDVLCLQEVRARQEQVDKASLERLREVYPHVTWNAARRGGYSGVATLARATP